MPFLLGIVLSVLTFDFWLPLWYLYTVLNTYIYYSVTYIYDRRWYSMSKRNFNAWCMRGAWYMSKRDHWCCSRLLCMWYQLVWTSLSKWWVEQYWQFWILLLPKSKACEKGCTIICLFEINMYNETYNRTTFLGMDWGICEMFRVRIMAFSATFNNISVISCRSVLLVEETGVPRENHWPVGSHW